VNELLDTSPGAPASGPGVFQELRLGSGQVFLCLNCHFVNDFIE